MPNTYTLYYNLAKPSKFDLDWEDELNGNFDNIDSLIKNVNNELNTHKNNQTNPHQVSFLQLTDTPSSYSGLANRVVVVNNNANGITTVTKVPAAVVADYTLSVYSSANFPENPEPGETFFNTSDKKMYFWNTTEWVEIHPKNKDTYLDYGGTNQVSATDVKDAVTKKHEKNKDTYLDYGGTNQVSASQAKTAYTNNHTHSNKTLLDTYTQTEANLADAVTKKHNQNKDTYLDYGGTNQIAASDIKTVKSTVDNATNLATANTLVKRDANGRARVSSPQDSSDIVNKSYLESSLLNHVNDFNPHPGIGSYQDLIYTNGVLTQINESVNSVLRKKTTLTYTNGILTSVNVKIYGTDGSTIISQYTDTLTYSNNILESVERSYA